MKKEIKKIETPEHKAQREIAENIAKNLEYLARNVSALINGPLKKKTLLILLAHSSGLSQRDVESVLNALQTLPKDFLN